jgi:hypothetical protein
MTRVPLDATLDLELGILGEKHQAVEVVGTIRLLAKSSLEAAHLCTSQKAASVAADRQTLFSNAIGRGDNTDISTDWKAWKDRINLTAEEERENVCI